MTSNAKAAETTTSATEEDDSEWMDGATASFPKTDDLAPTDPGKFGPGRLVAIWAKEKGSRLNEEGKPYPFVETLTLVLDDGPDGDQATELVGPAPVRLEGFQHSTTGLVARLEKRVKGVNAKNIPLRFRPMIGRMNTQASKKNKKVAAFSISEPTAEDMIIARKYKDMITTINRELEEAEKAAEDTAAFE